MHVSYKNVKEKQLYRNKEHDMWFYVFGKKKGKIAFMRLEASNRGKKYRSDDLIIYLSSHQTFISQLAWTSWEEISYDAEFYRLVIEQFFYQAKKANGFTALNKDMIDGYESNMINIYNIVQQGWI